MALNGLVGTRQVERDTEISSPTSAVVLSKSPAEKCFSSFTQPARRRPLALGDVLPAAEKMHMCVHALCIGIKSTEPLVFFPKYCSRSRATPGVDLSAANAADVQGRVQGGAAEIRGGAGARAITGLRERNGNFGRVYPPHLALLCARAPCRSHVYSLRSQCSAARFCVVFDRCSVKRQRYASGQSTNHSSWITPVYTHACIIPPLAAPARTKINNSSKSVCSLACRVLIFCVWHANMVLDAKAHPTRIRSNLTHKRSRLNKSRRQMRGMRHRATSCRHRFRMPRSQLTFFGTFAVQASEISLPVAL